MNQLLIEIGGLYKVKHTILPVYDDYKHLLSMSPHIASGVRPADLLEKNKIFIPLGVIQKHNEGPIILKLLFKNQVYYSIVAITTKHNKSEKINYFLTEVVEKL